MISDFQMPNMILTHNVPTISAHLTDMADIPMLMADTDDIDT